MYLTDGIVKKRKKLCNNTYHIKIILEKSFPHYKVGNFIMLHLKEGFYPILARPFSIFKAEKDCLELVFRDVGTGTGLMAKKSIPFEVRIWGPLGNAFPEEQDVIYVAGGLGLAPLYNKIIEDNKNPAFVGFRTLSEGFFLKALEKRGAIINTDDGSYGNRGFVTESLKEYIKNNPYLKKTIFACGPIGLLKSLWQIGKKIKNLQIFASFETHMACGFGVCLGCAIETPKGIVKVCKDGPVFLLNDIFGD